MLIHTVGFELLTKRWIPHNIKWSIFVFFASLSSELSTVNFAIISSYQLRAKVLELSIQYRSVGGHYLLEAVLKRSKLPRDKAPALIVIVKSS